MKKIGIIGGGFAGTMTAANLIDILDEACEIIIVNERESFNKGIAFNPYSSRHLLNVVAGKMGAYPGQETDFLEWVVKRPEFKNKDKGVIANSFLPRKLYGTYLVEVWEHSSALAKSKGIRVTVIDAQVVDLSQIQDSVMLSLSDGTTAKVDHCVIATGNHLPKNPTIDNPHFFNSKKYFRNPWQIEAVQSVDNSVPVLIVGNGLTMVDTVLGLLEHNFKGEIYSLSPHGFRILPHRHNGICYTKLEEELTPDINLYELVKLVNKHIKSVREFGVSAEPIIDSLRPHTQRIWQTLTNTEKKVFMSRLRHLWGVARHRIPLHIHDKIQQLQIDGRLHVVAGKLLECSEQDEFVSATFLNRKSGSAEKLKVSRVINCTGPDSDLANLDGHFLKNCMLKDILSQDDLKLGIRADTSTFQVFNSQGKKINNLYTIGSNLRGELWESTAVGELRVQARRLAERLAMVVQPSSSHAKK